VDRWQSSSADPCEIELAYLSIDLLFVDVGIKKRRSQVRNPDAPHIYRLAVLFYPVNPVRGGTLGVNVTMETNPVGNFASPADRTLNVSTYAQSSPDLIHDCLSHKERSLLKKSGLGGDLFPNMWV